MLRTLALATALGTLALLAACANPADNKPVATVSDPAPAVSTPAPAAGTPAPAAAAADTTETETADPSNNTLVITSENSKVNFTGSKVTGKHEGGFQRFSGTISLVDADPVKSHLRFEILTDSIYTDTEKLTGHLKSPDFFDVAQFPTAVFETSAITKTAAGYDVTGNLTLHGVTKTITFPAQIEATPDSVTAKAEFVIKRMDFGIVYPGKTDDLIRDEVVIRLDINAKRG